MPKGKKGFQKYNKVASKENRRKIEEDFLRKLPNLNTSDPSTLSEEEFRMFKYFRKRPWRAAELIVIGDKNDLEIFQKLALWLMFKKNFLLLVFSRGGSKTYLLGLYACVKALLYPNSKIGIIAPSFRQAKHVFVYVIKFYRDSKLFAASFEKAPVIQQDLCTCLMWNGSTIQAIPTGDGSKIRGSRFYDILVDEYAQVEEEILNVVILGMGATTQDPIKNAKMYRYIERLKREKKPYKHLLKRITTNRIIGTSTAYYQFNHLWDTIKNYYEIILRKNKDEEYEKYGVMKIPYTILPKGFMDDSFIEMSKKKMSSYEFDMEFKTLFPSDSDGFFKASMVAKSFINIYMFDFTDDNESEVFERGMPKFKGDDDKQYILAIDPARSSDDCSFCVIEIDYYKGSHLVVCIEYINNKKFKAAAEKVWDLMRRFNIIGIYMDAAGGGTAIKDYLNDPMHSMTMTKIDQLHRELIWDAADPYSYLDGEGTKKKDIDKLFEPKPGRHMLKMINFTGPWLSNANHALHNALDTNKLLFPRKLNEEDLRSATSLEAKRLTKIEESFQKLKKQLGNIIMTKTSSGIPHWDTAKPRDKKDLYTSILIGYYELTLRLTGKVPDIDKKSEVEVFGGFAEQLDAKYGNVYDRELQELGIAVAAKPKPSIHQQRHEDYFEVAAGVDIDLTDDDMDFFNKY